MVKLAFPLTSSRKVWLQRSTVAGRRFQSSEQSWDIFQGNWQIISRNIKHSERDLTPANSCGFDLEDKLLNASPLSFLKEMSSDTWTTFCHKCKWSDVENSTDRSMLLDWKALHLQPVCSHRPPQNQHVLKQSTRRQEKSHLAEIYLNKEWGQTTLN